jgi:hypothetical protein
MNHHLRVLVTFLVSLTLLSLALGGSMGAALAVQAVAHGQGVLWNVDRTSWIGNYELDDGNRGYCLDVTKPQPAGAEFDYSDGSKAGWFSADDSARLAFISRHWGAPDDPYTAAAAQLAIWTITGLAGHDQAYFAQRANGRADDVVDAANQMLRVANGASGASRGVSASVRLDLSGPAGRVTSDLVVDYISGAVVPAAGSFRGQMTLRGATFGDGSRSATVSNGVTTTIRPDQVGAAESVSAEVVYTDLPFGPSFRLGKNTGASQDLLVTHPFPAEARASASATGPSELPFRPRVQTTTSTAVADPGTELTDELRLDVHPESPTGGEWGVYAAADGTLKPIPVVIESTLWGPFPRRPALAPDAPQDAPVVCTVETLVESGPGSVGTEPCVVPSAGFYVWTDSIDPRRTPPQRGGDRLQGWRSDFGVAEETTLVPATPRIETVASIQQTAEPRCVSDRLAVSGLPQGIEPIEVTTTLIGPLAQLPHAGRTPADWQSLPVAGRVVTSIAADGEHDSACIQVTEPGHYYFIFESTPHDALVAGESVVPAFSDTRVHSSEAIEFTAPPVSPPTSPPTPTATPPATAPPAAVPPVSPTPAPRLAQTGGTGGLSVFGPSGPMATAGSVLAVTAGLGALAFALRRRS